jgi:uncharacterized membrane protein YfcA
LLAIAIIAGIAIGISLGALGGGGSILTVPVLVYALSESPKTATTASLIIVGITGLTGAIGHARAGRVRWRAGLLFGLLGTVASLGGSKLNHSVNPQVLLLAFAGLMVIAAAAMISRSRKPSEDVDTDNSPSTGKPHRTPPHPPAGAVPPQPGTPPTPGTVMTAAPAEAAADTQNTSSGVGGIIKVVAAALIVGFLTGFFGVGGGFVIVPALVVALRYKMPTAVGTSLIIIAINSAGALAVRIGHSSIPWHVVVPFTTAAIIGSLAGKRVADKASGNSLTRAFAVLLIAVAIYVAIRAGLQL